MTFNPESPLRGEGSESERHALVSTDYSLNDFRISIDGVSVCLTHQRRGEEPRQRITIARQEFNKMIQWYTKPQKLRTVKEIARSVMRIASEPLAKTKTQALWKLRKTSLS